jgi:hypothetical protein
MDRLGSVKKLAAGTLVAMATALVAVAPSAADGTGQYTVGNRPGAMQGPGAVPGSRRDFDGHHGHGGRHHHFDHKRRLYVTPFAYWGFPYYVYQAPGYYWYCPSYEDYYPNVDSCPEAWVPIPAS